MSIWGKIYKLFILRKKSVTDSVGLEYRYLRGQDSSRTFLNNAPVLCSCLSHSNKTCCSISDVLEWMVTWRGRDERYSFMKEKPQRVFPCPPTLGPLHLLAAIMTCFSNGRNACLSQWKLLLGKSDLSKGWGQKQVLRAPFTRVGSPCWQLGLPEQLSSLLSCSSLWLPWQCWTLSTSSEIDSTTLPEIAAPVATLPRQTPLQAAPLL